MPYKKTKPISQILAEKTYKGLDLDSQGNPLPSKKHLTPPKSSYSPPKTPFKIKDLERTQRQSPKGKSYRYSAIYRNAVALRLLVKTFTSSLNPKKHHRYITQIDSAARSVVANIREGYTRPSTKEYLDFLGYSQGSLEEVRGDIEDAKDDGLLPNRPGTTLASIGIHLAPPKTSYQSPKQEIEPLRDLKRQIRVIKSHQLTYQIFIELTNKTNFLLKRTVTGLQQKLVKDTKSNLNLQLQNHWSNNW